MAMVSPLWSWNDTSRTALTMPPSTLKVDGKVAGVEDQLAAMGTQVVAFRMG